MENQIPSFSTIGERIKYLQEDILKLTPNRFAKEAGLAYNTLRSLYDSDKDPRRSTIKKVIDSFDGFLNPAWLIEGKGRPTLSATGEHPAFAKITSEENWTRAGKLIRKKIRLSGKTTDQVAKAAGETKFFIEKTLRGKAAPTPMLMGTLMLQTGTNLDQLAEELGIDLPKKEKPAPKQKVEPEVETTAEENTTPEAQQTETAPVTPAAPAVAQEISAPVYSDNSSAMAGGNAAQELRMKVEILANRVAYLEERLARMAQ